MLNTSYVQIGVLSATKGLISGDIQLIMSNGDVLNCNEYCGAIALPTDFQQLERIVTDADLQIWFAHYINYWQRISRLHNSPYCT
ncbi:meiotic recombination protein W68 [Drosophila busckii]|uniref:meiotic recombination protein W68 n=1 Tax=Drosophila busckii TaxID=30019 RepID=UPI001433032E|nr:meiotic recombination protein W68 [Drosophila busckii]